MGVPVTDKLGSVYRGADMECILNVIARRAAAKLPTTSLPDTCSRVGRRPTTSSQGVSRQAFTC